MDRRGETVGGGRSSGLGVLMGRRRGALGEGRVERGVGRRAVRLSGENRAKGGRDGGKLGREKGLGREMGRGGGKLMGVGVILFRLIAHFRTLLRYPGPARRVDFVHPADRRRCALAGTGRDSDDGCRRTRLASLAPSEERATSCAL